MSGNTWVLIGVALLAFACSEESSATTELTWCDVAPIVAEKCSGCHAQEPTGGAPFPLVTREDFLESVASDGSSSTLRYERAHFMVDGQRMPPSDSVYGSLSCEERESLLSWFAAAVPTGPAECEGVAPQVVNCSSALR